MVRKPTCFVVLFVGTVALFAAQVSFGADAPKNSLPAGVFRRNLPDLGRGITERPGTDYLLERSSMRARTYKNPGKSEIVLDNQLIRRTWRLAPNGALWYVVKTADCAQYATYSRCSL